MTQKQAVQGQGMGFVLWLQLLFIGLRLTKHIDWSWWWVLSPLWIGVAAILGFAVLLFAGALIYYEVKGVRR